GRSPRGTGRAARRRAAPGARRTAGPGTARGSRWGARSSPAPRLEDRLGERGGRQALREAPVGQEERIVGRRSKRRAPRLGEAPEAPKRVDAALEQQASRSPARVREVLLGDGERALVQPRRGRVRAV